jgi:hypothetical protein
VGALLSMALAGALLQGCAALLPVNPQATGAAGGATPTASAGGAAAATPRAVVDSLPSADAQRVLESIPEPIPAAERVPPPAVPSAADSARAGAGTDAAADTQGAAVPVPEPTAPLGDRPGSAELAAAAGGAAIAGDSLAARGAGGSGAAGGAAGAASGAAAKPGARSGAGGAAPAGATLAGPCYRLQVAASADHAQAESMKRAAESQLELPFTIAKVKTLYKVRTRDCLGQQAAETLRTRARASGFGGAFTIAEGAK